MFYSRMEKHEVQRLKTVDDGLGFATEEYGEPEPLLAYIVRTSNEQYTANETNLTLEQYSAYTTEEVPKGSLIDSRFKVEDCFPAHHGYTCYLSRVGGRYGE